jgi:hypothetical protein
MTTPDHDERQTLLDTIDGMAQQREDRDSIIQAAADGLRSATDLDQIFVMICDDDEPLLRMRYASLGRYEQQQIRNSMNLDLRTVTVELGDEPMLTSFFRCGQLAELETISEVAELARAIAPKANIAAIAADAVRNQGIGYACVMPILAGEDLKGVLIASRYGRKPLPNEDSALVQAIAALMGPALANGQ